MIRDRDSLGLDSGLHQLAAFINNSRFFPPFFFFIFLFFYATAWSVWNELGALLFLHRASLAFSTVQLFLVRRATRRVLFERLFLLTVSYIHFISNLLHRSSYS